MSEEKDRLGDKLRDLEKAREDDYFARRDREILEKMRKGGTTAPEVGEEKEKEKGGR